MVYASEGMWTYILRGIGNVRFLKEGISINHSYDTIPSVCLQEDYSNKQLHLCYIFPLIEIINVKKSTQVVKIEMKE